jgi:hypothetical protein
MPASGGPPAPDPHRITANQQKPTTRPDPASVPDHSINGPDAGVAADRHAGRGLPFLSEVRIGGPSSAPDPAN